jgi:ApbE superfamily uncharacterized protein (UPF0280 family)
MTIHAAMLSDGRRLHLQHGPIDLVIEAFGERDQIETAYAQAVEAFGDVLTGLVSELPLLRAPLGAVRPVLNGPVAARMVGACWPHRDVFITPMAAVAGAVADHVLECMLRGLSLPRAYVNDGGDIAFHVAPGERLTCGVATDVALTVQRPILRDAALRAAPQDEVVKLEPPHPEEPFGAEAANGVSKDGQVRDLAASLIDGAIALTADMPVRGIATSGRACKGRGGRSFSLGIADAVTVLAADAAAADAAATIIANSVDLPGHPGIGRAPAAAIDPDSDLGDHLVTLDVPALERHEADRALRAGVAKAEALRQAGLIFGAVLVLQRRFAQIGPSLAKLAA